MKINENILLNKKGQLLTCWAPYFFPDNCDQTIEIRFNNHWHNYLNKTLKRYKCIITDSKGNILTEKIYSLKDYSSGLGAFSKKKLILIAESYILDV